MDDNFQLDEDSGIPLWVQLKNRLTYLIKTGVYRENDRLLTVRELSVRLEVAYNTVSKVYQDLERDGLIKLKRGSGTYVTYAGGNDFDRPDMVIETLILELVDKSRELGMRSTEVIGLLEKHLERTGEEFWESTGD